MTGTVEPFTTMKRSMKDCIQLPKKKKKKEGVAIKLWVTCRALSRADQDVCTENKPQTPSHVHILALDF